MSEESEDKDLPATDKKRQDAEKNGDVYRITGLSSFLSMSILMIPSAMILWTLIPYTQRSLSNETLWNNASSTPEVFFSQWAIEMGQWLSTLLIWSTSCLSLMILLSFALNFMVGGSGMSQGIRIFSVNKLNPINNVKQLFSSNAPKSLWDWIKLILLMLYLFLYFSSILPYFLKPLSTTPQAFSIEVVEGFFLFFLGILVFYLIESAFALYKREQRLKMSLKELKDELKQNDGDPFIKSKIKAKARQLAQQRSMDNLPTANVVLMNPTHYAVALKWDPEKDAAPRVVAKGADAFALAIKAKAQELKLPILESPPLTRMLFALVPLNHTIPDRFFRAVALVIGWAIAYQNHNKNPNDIPPPAQPIIHEHFWEAEAKK